MTRLVPAVWEGMWHAFPAVLVLLSSLAGGAAAPDRDDLTGRVVDATGKGIAAHVWVIGDPVDQPEVVAETSADLQGAFRVPGFWGDRGKTKEQPVALQVGLFARDRDGRVGWQTLVLGRTPAAPLLLLREKGESRGRVTDASGTPIAGAEVAPYGFSMPAPKGTFPEFIRLTPELAAPYTTRTGADGAFLLRDIPRGSMVITRVTAPGFGAPRASWDSGTNATITLDRRVGRIEGRAVTTDGKAPGAPFTVALRRSAVPNVEPAPGAVGLGEQQTVRVGPDGAFRFDRLQPGRYLLWPSSNPESPFEADPLRDVEVGPGATVSGLTMTLRRLITVRGRVVDAKTGAPIGGVGVRATRFSGRRMESGARATTDSQGRYRINIAAGTTEIWPQFIPPTYLGIFEDARPRFDVTADRDWPDLKLRRATTLDGVVVDAAGKPVAEAEVQLIRSDPAGSAFNVPMVRSGPDGTFHLLQLDPDDTLPVRARTKTETTDGAVVVRPKDQKGPLRLTIAAATTAHVRGVVADRAGKPVAGAKLSLWWRRDYVSEKARQSSAGSLLETYTTDASGRFASSALWPGDRYQVSILAEGFSKTESPELTAHAGMNDYGTIALLGTSTHVAGRVVDTAGKPVAGATAFNHGDGPHPVTTTTGPDGRFRLDGLFAGAKYVFARRDGFRFTGVRVEQDRDDLTITLRRNDESPATWAPVFPSVDEQTALAKASLTRFWERYGKDATRNGAFVCLLYMTRIDPALALKWSADAGGRYNGRVNCEAAEVLAERDTDGAIELLQASGFRVWYTLQQLARRYADSDRAKALRFAEEAAVQARAMEQPERAGAMAETGALLARIGRKDAGRKLIEEAADPAARMGTDPTQAYERGRVAGALALFDLPRALALIEPIKDPEARARYFGMVAHAIAPTDPKRATELADTMSGSGITSLPLTSRTAVAYAVGTDHPDEAVKIIEGMKGSMAPKFQAEAFAWLAVAVAPHDRKRAEALIDRALTMTVDHPEGFQSWSSYGGGTGSAAWIAACAKRAGYPDMASVVARVLASRSTEERGMHAESVDIEEQATAAAILALTDPQAARQLLRDVEARSGLDSAALARAADRHWLQAWALVDPKHARELFDAELVALAGQRDVNLQMSGPLNMAEVLVVPPGSREEVLRKGIGGTWYPGAPE